MSAGGKNQNARFQDGKKHFLKGSTLNGMQDEIRRGRAIPSGPGIGKRQTPTGVEFWLENRAQPMGFDVTASSAGKVAVHPSVVLGLSAGFEEPVIGTTSLFASTPPELTVSANNWVFLRIEIEPAALGSGPYFLDEENYTVESVTVIADADDDDAQVAEIDETTGTETNLVALLPLAKLDANKLPAFQVLNGPLAVRYCSGRLDVKPPVILHTGNLKTVSA